MKSSVKPQFGRIGGALLSSLLTITFFLCFASASVAQSYSSPLVITKGGTYKGNWESRNSEVAAVEVRTSEPVVIENSNIRGAGYLIKSWGYSTNLTVRHTSGYGLTQTPYRDYKKPRRFVTVNNFQNVVIENCYMESTAGIYIGTRYEGNGSTSQTVRVRYNIAKNIDGRVYGGDKEHSQFLQFNFKGAIRHAEIAWNQITNEADKSLVEDNINIYNTRGTSDNPIRIHNNYIQGAFPVSASSTKYSGGGIITDGNAGISDCPAYIEAYENHLVGLGNYAMGIAGGNNIRYHHNRAVNAATFVNGSRYQMYTSGFWSKDYYRQNTTFANSVDNNVVGIVAWGYKDNRNDISVAENASFKSNTFLPNPITLQTEKDEFSRWEQKLQQQRIALGPNGSAPAAKQNQAPAISLVAPTANAEYALSSAITLTANATDVDGSIAKVEFYIGSDKIGEDASAPYTLAWNKAIAGNHILTAKAYDNEGATATCKSVTIQVTAQVAAITAPTTATSAGKIVREFWAGVHGNSISDIPVGTKPTTTTELTSFEAPTNVADTYGQRISGYVTAPASGQYTFWIASDDKAALYLSTSEDAGKKSKIAEVNSWTNPREWAKHSSQQSVKITLEAGKRYYIEALHLEGGGGDNLAVGWQLPGGAMERPIAGNRLSPATQTTAVQAVQAADHDAFPSVATAYPNPFSDVLVLSLPAAETKLAEVAIYGQDGKLLHKVSEPTMTSNKVELHVGDLNLGSGLYILRYTNKQGKTNSLKVIKM